MAYQHYKLAVALGWKYSHAPGICTSDGWLTAWPDALGPMPDDLALAQCVTDYSAYMLSNQCKDDELQCYLDSIGGKVAKAITGVLIDKGVCTMTELKQKYRSL